MKESKCWLDENTGKIVFDDIDMAWAFNIQKQEALQDYLESAKMLKEHLRDSIIGVMPTALKYEPSTWETIKEIADEEIKRLQ